MPTHSLVVATIVSASLTFGAAGVAHAQEAASAAVQPRWQEPATPPPAASEDTSRQTAAAPSDRTLARIGEVGRPSGRSNLMLALYASTVTLQGLDVHSTLTGLKHGAVEANPFMTGITARRPVFIAVKAAVAATTVIAAHRLAKRNKVAAVVMLTAVNGAYAYVVARNYRVAGGFR